jgi:hypothetical protein
MAFPYPVRVGEMPRKPVILAVDDDPPALDHVEDELRRRVAAAVGEGSVVISQIHQYLTTVPVSP